MVGLGLLCLLSTEDTLPLWTIGRGDAPDIVYQEALSRLRAKNPDPYFACAGPEWADDTFYLYPFPKYSIPEDTPKSLLIYKLTQYPNEGYKEDGSVFYGGLWYPYKWPPAPGMLDSLIGGNTAQAIKSNSKAIAVLYWNEPDHAMWRVQESYYEWFVDLVIILTS